MKVIKLVKNFMLSIIVAALRRLFKKESYQVSYIFCFIIHQCCGAVGCLIGVGSVVKPVASNQLHDVLSC